MAVWGDSELVAVRGDRELVAVCRDSELMAVWYNFVKYFLI